MVSTIKVGQVRDSIDIDRTMPNSCFAVVTMITKHKGATIITYDAVTDSEIIRNMTMGKWSFESIYPVVYMEDVKKSVFFKHYKNL